jgi:hypothetical protein
MQTPTFLTKLSDESIILIIDVGKNIFFSQLLIHVVKVIPLNPFKTPTLELFAEDIVSGFAFRFVSYSVFFLESSL